MTAAVPLVDLAWQHRVVADRVAAGFADVLGRTAFVDGAEVADFERRFAAASGVAHCVTVANGTDAIELGLRALALPAGAGVALPANTFIATLEAVVRAGLTPVVVDVDDDHGLLDPVALDRAAAGCRAVVPVHLHGQLAPMPALLDVARRHDLRVLEDGAQSHLATQAGRCAGSWGDLAATSFYPGKNLGAYGDGGAVLTDDDDLAAQVRTLRGHGTAPGADRYTHTMMGMNSRLDTLQAVVLTAKLEHQAAWNDLRRQAADLYHRLLSGRPDLALPRTAPGNVHSWHIYAIRVASRDQVLALLREAGVGAGAHYPVPVHQQPAMHGWIDPSARFPAAEAATRETLSLPLYPGITTEQQERVVDVLLTVLDDVRSGEAALARRS